MIERTAPNGAVIQFPEGTPEETINEYLSLDEYKAVEPQETAPQKTVPQTTVLADKERSFLTDIPLQIVGGARDSIQSTINLVDKIGDTLGVGDPNKDLYTLPEIDTGLL